MDEFVNSFFFFLESDVVSVFVVLILLFYCFIFN